MASLAAPPAQIARAAPASPAPPARPGAHPVAPRLHIDAPQHVTMGGEFTVRLHGQAPGRATLELTLDFRACAPTPAAELKRAEAPALRLTVDGRFSKLLRAEVNRRGTDHVCGFLLAAPRGRVIARARTGFPVRQ